MIRLIRLIRLIRNEFRKFRGSCINTVAFAAMLFPVLFTAPVYYFGNSFQMEWGAYINSLHLFYGIFLGAFVPSFLAIFTVHTELRNGTVKNMVASPHGRQQMIAAKTLYVALFVVMLYIGAGVLVLLSGVIIGLPTTAADVWRVFQRVSVTGMTTVVLVPMMMFFTLVFRNIAAPIVITFLGTVVGIPMINLGKSYWYPWMIPTNFFFRFSSSQSVNFTGPLVLLLVLTLGFSLLSVLRFRRMDFDT